MQSKKHSLVETLTNTAIGFIGSLVIINLILPFLGYQIKPSESLFVVIVFTVWSIARGYGVRRFFNYIHNKNYIQGDR